MLKLPITYTDYNGNTQTENFYFNVTKPELVELEVEHEMGFQAYLQAIVDADNRKALIEEFKRIITLAYGEKSDDGKRFVKNAELTEAFTQHPAYSELFMKLATDYDYAAKFIVGVVPADLEDEIGQEMSKSSLLPPPPA